MRIKMVSIPVNDPAAAYQFYTGTLGFHELQVMPEHRLYIVRSPEDPNGVGLLLEPSENPVSKAFKEGVYKLGLPIIVFGTKNVQAEYERLTAAGVRFTAPPKTDPWGTSAVFDDTCGNLIQLHQD